MENDRMLLNTGWRFALTEDENALLPEFDDRAYRVLNLPHDWQVEGGMRQDAPGGGAQGFFSREQAGVYRLHFDAPESWRGKTVHVLFEGVQRFSRVYLNGRAIGGHSYGYVPFLCEMTGLRYGESNLLAVAVDNRQQPNEYAASGDRWYSGAGIFRDVYLLVDEPTHLTHDGLRIVAAPHFRGPSGDVPDVLGVRCDLATAEITVEVEGDCAGHTVEVELLAPDGRVVETAAASAEAKTCFSLDIRDPRLWSPDTPVCYRVRAKLLRGGSVADEESSAFGVRSAVFDEEDGFVLNCVKTKLWGVNLHHDGGVLGAAVPGEVWRRRLLALKRMGCNTIRCAHTPLHEDFYRLCDELGFLVIDEYCDKWQNSRMYFDRIADEERLADLTALVRRDANHPCVILWSVGNEIGIQYSEYFYDRLKCFADHVRALDPTRGVTAALIGFVLKDFNDTTPLGKKLAAARRYADIVDVYMGNYQEQLYEKLRESGMRKPIIGSEVRMYYRHDERSMNTVDVSGENPYDICKRHDWVCGAIVWAGVDYLGESSGWPCRGWTGNPLDSTADWKLRAWYLAAQWKREPVLKLCVYDESEPWDMARGLWGFPQMRSHWKYTHFEKVLHVAAMTNCDTVKLYQNAQTVRTAYAADSRDGMIHFYVPYIPGQLRAEGYRAGVKVCDTVLYSDYDAAEMKVIQDCETLPADGRSIAMIDLLLEDRHGQRYVLEDRLVKVSVSGGVRLLALDNGNAMDTAGGFVSEKATFNGHLLVMVQSTGERAEGRVTLEAEGFEPRTVTIGISGR